MDFQVMTELEALAVDFLVFMFRLLVAIVCTGLVIFLLIWIFRPNPPTADQLYGCTIKQQAPNGDCP